MKNNKYAAFLNTIGEKYKIFLFSLGTELKQLYSFIHCYVLVRSIENFIGSLEESLLINVQYLVSSLL